MIREPSPRTAEFLLRHEQEIRISGAVFDNEPLYQLICEFIGDPDDSTGDESSEDDSSVYADSHNDDSQNFDPDERYAADRLFYDRHGRFCESDDDSNEEFYWSGNGSSNESD